MQSICISDGGGCSRTTVIYWDISLSWYRPNGIPRIPEDSSNTNCYHSENLKCQNVLQVLDTEISENY